MVCNYFSRKSGKEYFRSKGCLNFRNLLSAIYRFLKLCLSQTISKSPLGTSIVVFLKNFKVSTFKWRKWFLKAGFDRALVELEISPNVPYPLTQNLGSDFVPYPNFSKRGQNVFLWFL